MNELIIAALGSGCFGAVVGFISSRMSRHDAVKDKTDTAQKTLKEHAERLESLEESITALGVVLDALKMAQQALMRDRIQHLGKVYISKGEIAADDLETFYSLHERYKALGGNGYCDAITEKVRALPIVT